MKKNISLIIQRKNEKKKISIFSYPIVKNFINDHFLKNKKDKAFTVTQHSFFTVINQFTQFVISKIKLITLFLLVFISMIKLT